MNKTCKSSDGIYQGILPAWLDTQIRTAQERVNFVQANQGLLPAMAAKSDYVLSEIKDSSDYQKYYSTQTCCWNCQKRIYRWIKKGIPLDKIVVECGECGCPVNLKNGRV